MLLSKSRSLRAAVSNSAKPKPIWKSLTDIIAPEKWHIGGAAVALTATSGGTLAFPYFTGKLMDGFSQSGQDPEMWMELVHTNALACVGALSIIGLSGFTRAYLLETASEKISRRLRLDLFQDLLQKQPQLFFDTVKTGDLVSRFGNDVTRVSRSIMDGAFGFRVCINAVAGTTLVANFVPVTILPQLLAPVALMFLGGVAYGRFVRSISRRIASAQSASMEICEENLSLVRIVKMLNGESRAISEYEKSLNNVYSLAQLNALATGGRVAAFVSIGGGFIVHVIYQCGMLISTGTLSIGQTSALAGYLLVCGNSYQGIVTAYGDLQKALGACERLVALKQPVTLHSVFPSRPVVFSSPPSIEFRNVGFEYEPGKRRVLNDFNLYIPGGAKQAIVGLSGCGKSSLLLLLAKLYLPTNGEILLNTTNINEIDTQALRSELLAIVPQETALFNTSIRGNVWYPNAPPEMHENEEKNLAEKARLSLFVNDWEAPVGERGQALSGGERQRVVIARALAKKAPVLLLDEATSALDQESDGVILKGLRNTDQTIMAITHRLSAIEWSDRLAVIDNGKVVQQGNTIDLLKQPGPILQRLLKQVDQ